MSSTRRDTTYPVEGNQNYTRVQNCAKFYTTLRATNQYANQWKYTGSTAYTAGYTVTHATSGYISSNVTSAATGDYTLVTSTSNPAVAATTSTALTLPNDALIQAVIMEAASGTTITASGGTINVQLGLY